MGQVKRSQKGGDLLPEADSCDTPVNMAMFKLAGMGKKHEEPR